MKKFFLPAMLALMMFTAGCEQPPVDNPPPDPPKPSTTTTPVEKPEVKPEVKSSVETTKPSKIDENPPPAHTKKSAQKMNVKIYYPDDSGLKLVEVEREIVIDDATDKYIAAVETLREDPVEENLTRIFPSNAAIRSITVNDGMATVDFDGKILKSFVGGSTGEEFLIGSIVNTLTNFPEITCVKFLVDGQEIETLSGHMDLSIPLERMSSLTE